MILDHSIHCHICGGSNLPSIRLRLFSSTVAISTTRRLIVWLLGKNLVFVAEHGSDCDQLETGLSSICRQLASKLDEFLDLVIKNNEELQNVYTLTEKL